MRGGKSEASPGSPNVAYNRCHNMSDLTRGRHFQLWEYHVSHGSLLIRSPSGPGVAAHVDIICVGVEYVAAPRHLGEIKVSPATADEIRHVETLLRKSLPPSRVWALRGSSASCLVVAAGLQIREDRGELFGSAFSRPFI